jgi:hypothetical protein
MKTGQGIVFAVYNVAFCLLYFRMYPRITSAAPPGTAEPTTPPRPPPSS